MSFSFILLCATAVGAIFLLTPLKELKNSYFIIAVTGLSLLLTVYSIKGVVPIFNYLKDFSESELSVYFKTLIKVLGISVICNITTDLANDMGMGGISGKIDFGAKVAIMLSALPILDKLLVEIKGLI